MCGIAGTVGVSSEDALSEMLLRLRHRGPDDEGMYRDRAHQVSLGHRRLSIIDLSPLGHQPMSDESGTIWTTFNGEIYNYKRLADDLRSKGCVFNSGSDTEVLVHGYAQYGADIFNKIDGMWAVALYDARRGTLLFSRDPAGMKPLYLYRAGAQIFFASEIDALASVLPATARTLDKGAIANYLAHGYVPGDATFYTGIRSIAPGTTLTIDLTSGAESSVAYTPRRSTSVPSFDGALEEFETLFAQSVQDTLQADVPVGIFLSGGIDSALVAYHAQKAGARLHAFTIGFEESGFDESATAGRIAEHFGFPHFTHTLRASDIASDIEIIFDAFGQPFADTSSLPTFYLSRLAREHGYKVVLSGDGADELFGGYPTHYLPAITRWYQLAPRVIDSVLSSLATSLPTSLSALGTKEKLTRFLWGARHDPAQAHALWKRVFTDEELALLVSDTELLSLDTSFTRYFDALRGTNANAIDQMIKVDFATFLTSDCLVKGDICAMQSGVEVRAPFLTKEIIDFACALPSDYKAHLFQTKRLLRHSLARVLPRDITRLPKRGFVPPLARWLRADLRPRMLDMLSSDAVARIGFVDYTYVSDLIEEHLANTHDHTKKLWALMSLSHFFSKQSL